MKSSGGSKLATRPPTLPPWDISSSSTTITNQEAENEMATGVSVGRHAEEW
jgi:hypothetical protein